MINQSPAYPQFGACALFCCCSILYGLNLPAFSLLAVCLQLNYKKKVIYIFFHLLVCPDVSHKHLDWRFSLPPPSFCQLKQKHNIFKSVFLLSFHCLESSYRWVLMIMCIQFGWKGSYHALLTLILIKPGASAYVYLSLVWKNLTVLRALTLCAKHSSPFAACFQSAGGFGQPVYLQRASVARGGSVQSMWSNRCVGHSHLCCCCCCWSITTQ